METSNTTNLSKLTFIETFSPSQFMKEHNLDKIDVVVNPHTNKRFFITSNSAISGKADKTGAYKENPAISKCLDEATGEEFWMLHKQATDNVEHSFAL